MDYRDLEIYKRAREVISGLDREIKNWHHGMQAQETARQAFRAASSVGANIAEGHGRHVGKEYIHYLTIAQASANEVDHWLNTALDCQIGSAENLKALISKNQESRKMLSAAIRTLRGKS